MSIIDTEKQEEIFKNLQKIMESEPQKFWELYAQEYDGILHLSANQQTLEDVINAASITHRSTVLDLCCGTGNLGEKLLQKDSVPYRYYGFDRSFEMLKVAKSKLPHPNFFFHEKDVARALPEIMEMDQFGVICMINALYTMDEPKKVLQGIFQKMLTIPDSRLVIVTPKKNQFLGEILWQDAKAYQQNQDLWKTNDPMELVQLVPFCFKGEVCERLIRIFLMNAVIVQSATKQVYHFFSKEELIEMLNQIGFRYESHQMTHGGQCHLVVAKACSGGQNGTSTPKPKNSN